MQQMVTANRRPQDIYRKQGVMTASPLELVVMLYDGLKKNLVLGKRAIEKTPSDIAAAHKNFVKAQDIVAELMSSLDMSYQMSKELLALYEFIQKAIVDANVHKKTKGLNEVIEIIEELRDAWKQISDSARGDLYRKEG